MKIYTKTGDSGTTSLVGGERVSKDDPRVEAYGTVDELTAVLAYLRDSMNDADMDMGEFREDIRRILNTLMSVETFLAAGDGAEGKLTGMADTIPAEAAFLEQRIDYMNAELQPVTRFTIPGGHPLVSLSHVCRTVCRRAERSAVRVAGEYRVTESVLTYLNRLSDYLYQLGRILTQVTGAQELYWEPPR